jgi:hypothetical protein
MFKKLIEASKQQIIKGAYKLSFDERNEYVMVLNKKSGELSYVITGENDEMFISTLNYFGLKNQ